MSLKEISVLVIEDDIEDFHLARWELQEEQALCQCTYKLVHCQTLEEGLEYLKDNTPHLILLDLGLPDSEGLHGVLRLREATSVIPIVVLSGSDDDEGALEAIQAGAQDYLVKGKKDSTLSRTLRYAIQRQEILKNLENAEKAALTASRIKSTFLANMSHEIRTPLTAILGFTDLVIASEISDKNRKALSTVQRNARHLLQVINNILDISKIEAEELQTLGIPNDVFKLMGQLELTFRLGAQEKGLAFGLEYKFPVPRMLKVDALRLNQILINLIGNAIKFTKAGGVKVVLEYNEATSMLKFDVIDTGIGLSPEEKEKLFHPFMQCDNSSTRAFGGTGLGLVIAKKLAEAMGGDIQLQSTKGMGTVFCVSVLAEKVEGAEIVMEKRSMTEEFEQELDQSDDIPQVTGKVLLVDDMPDNQELMSYYLKECGAEVVVAENGRVAIEHVLQQDFDMIYLDMQMPVLDGYDCARLLRAQGKTLPIVAVTASAMDGAPERCLQAGCNDYIRKPFTPEVFYQMTAKYLKPREVKIDKSVCSSIIETSPKMAPVILGFVSRLPDRISSMEKNYRDENWTELRALAHNLAGADMFGFAELRIAAEQISQAAREREFHKIGKTIAELQILCEQIQIGKPELERIARSLGQ